jgi:ABC-type multidrug transport system fused ATPase/permease subunit
MIKGLRAATRAVLSTLLMLAFLVYIFAIIMNLLLKEKQEFVGVFDTIPNSMWTLLIDGTFLDNIGAITKKMQELEFMIASASTFVFMMFVLLAAMTVMNMLIGVLCEIVSMVARNEEEQQAVSLVKRTLLVMLQRLDEDLSGSVSFEELESLIEDHEALEVLESLEIDIKHLLQHFEMLYSEVTEVEIGVLMEMMLEFRGTRPVSVKDIIDITELLMFQVHQKFYELETSLKDSL